MDQATSELTAPPVPGRAIFDRLPWLADWRFLTGLTVIATVVATAQRLFLSTVNNFLIFRQSFAHLLAGTDLYARYPAEYIDLYKYSPTFALFMAPFRPLPVWLGVLVWNLVNALLPLLAVARLPVSDRAKAFILIFAFSKLIGAVQNAQSNGIVVALMIGAFLAFEARRPVRAALLVAGGTAIKLFGGAAGLLFLFYPGKARFMLAGVAFGVLLLLAPAPLTGLDALFGHFESWFRLLARDEVRSLSSSLSGFLDTLAGTRFPGWWLQAPALLLLALPLLRRSAWGDPAWRLLTLAHILVWVIVFNHQTESPTLVIALIGTALWGVVEPPSLWRTALLGVVFAFCALSSTDIFPPALRAYFTSHGFKILPLLAVELTIFWRLLRRPLAAPVAATVVPQAMPRTNAGPA